MRDFYAQRDDHDDTFTDLTQANNIQPITTSSRPSAKHETRQKVVQRDVNVDVTSMVHLH